MDDDDVDEGDLFAPDGPFSTEIKIYAINAETREYWTTVVKGPMGMVCDKHGYEVAMRVTQEHLPLGYRLLTRHEFIKSLAGQDYQPDGPDLFTLDKVAGNA